MHCVNQVLESYRLRRALSIPTRGSTKSTCGYTQQKPIALDDECSRFQRRPAIGMRAFVAVRSPAGAGVSERYFSFRPR
jgi:hypothetical protein